MSIVLQTPADPGSAFWGDGAAVPPVADQFLQASATVLVDKSYACRFGMVSPGETNSLPAPTFLGQQMTLAAGTSVFGASRVITSATIINQAGNTIMTFSSVNDFIKLEAINPSGVFLRWQVVSNDGVVLA